MVSFGWHIWVGVGCGGVKLIWEACMRCGNCCNPPVSGTGFGVCLVLMMIPNPTILQLLGVLRPTLEILDWTFCHASCLSLASGFPTGIISGFRLCPCSVWYCGLTTCPLYVGPLLTKCTLHELVCDMLEWGNNWLIHWGIVFQYICKHVCMYYSLMNHHSILVCTHIILFSPLDWSNLYSHHPQRCL